MKFCQRHWDALRTAIEERGLQELVAPDGQAVAAQMIDQLEREQAGQEPVTLDNYDPLMAAHWAIVTHVTEIGGPDALMTMMMPEEAGGVECPICYGNQAHDASCRQAECTWTCDHYIDGAADDELARVKAMRDGA